MTCSPVVLFVYNRIDHTHRTVIALSSNVLANKTDLIIFSDAARSLDKQASVDEVRAYLKAITGFRSVTIHHRQHNFGLAKSIITGVTQVFAVHERIIVLEDDMVTSPYFLTYMNDALEKYADDDRVVSIHGYVYPVKQSLPEAFFLSGADCWGWATWSRGWACFNSDGQFLLNELKRRKLISAFDYNGAYSFSTMLEDQIRGKNDSWAVRWHASAFLADKLTLYPGRSLVHNIGFDSSGSHCGTTGIYDAVLSAVSIDLSQVEMSHSIIAYQAFEDFFRQVQSGFLKRTHRFLIEIFRKVTA